MLPELACSCSNSHRLGCNSLVGSCVHGRFGVSCVMAIDASLKIVYPLITPPNFSQIIFLLIRHIFDALLVIVDEEPEECIAEEH